MKKAGIATILLLGIILVFGLACGDGESKSTLEPTPTYSPTSITKYQLYTDTEGQGSVSPSGGMYNAGSTVTLTATPAQGWRFDHWTGAASGTSRTLTINIDSNKSIVAHFVHPPISVTLDRVGVYSCSESFLRGETGEQYLYVIVTDGKTTLDLRVPSGGHFDLPDNGIAHVNRKIFFTPEIGDYLRLFVTGWESDGEGFEPLIYDAIGTTAATAADIGLTGGTGIGVMFGGAVGDLIGSFAGSEDDPLGNYEQIWFSSDSYGIGSYEDVGTDNLRLWFTISEG